ncbi:MAG: DUF4268 domain-containing protein [Rubrimonas sp.]|uniref:DUF4268 domain-containing protein n=1 Tax=Rubrimonas sp. TaxID=2036015 RepID=UPI002FDCED54
MKAELGKLDRVLNIRDAWPHEERDFSPWLSEEENLSELALALGFGRGAFLLEQTEARIGDFRADIIARVGSDDGDRILIENQFSQTNHDHLGKIATYAAGLDAKFVVWIAERIREEHRAALDWLNAISDDDHGFFGVELELWRIGDSPPAPRFNVVSRPNDWAKTVGDLTKSIGSVGEFGGDMLAFWTAFKEQLAGRGGALRSRKPAPQSWQTFAIGRTGFELQAFASARDKYLKVQLFIYRKTDVRGWNPDYYYNLFFTMREEIESELGFSPKWTEIGEGSGYHISIERPHTNPLDRQNWQDQHAWLAEKLEAFNRVFRPLILKLPMSQTDNPPE